MQSAIQCARAVVELTRSNSLSPCRAVEASSSTKTSQRKEKWYAKLIISSGLGVSLTCLIMCHVAGGHYLKWDDTAPHYFHYQMPVSLVYNLS